MRDIEHRIQTACVKWFRYAYPRLSLRLVAIPNGGARNISTAARLKEEGVVAGVSDLVLFLPRHGYGALCIEMKTNKGRQSDSQKAWQEAIQGEYLYVICRSLDDFIKIINAYIKG